MVAQASSSAMQGRKPPLQAQASLSPQLTPLGRHASTTRQHISIFGSSTIRQTGSQGWRGTTGCCNLLPQVEHRPQAVPADQLDVWDVVEYQQQPVKPSSTLCLGLVQQVKPGVVKVSPLIEEDEGMWVPEAEDAEAPDQQEQVPLDRVLRIVETVYGQRQDKEHNPHGEHAHDVWQVLAPLSQAVFRGGSGADSKS